MAMNTKHVWKTVVLIILMFMVSFGGYSESFLLDGTAYEVSVGYAFLFALAKVCISALLSMVIPLIFRLAEGQKLVYKQGKRLCLLNAIVTVIIPAVLDYAFVSILDAIFFYFINKWVFVYDKEST